MQWNEQGTHAVIGSYRSAVTGPLALAASIEATPLIVWAASASSLADRSVYPTLSRTNIHDGSFAKQLVRSLQALGWNRAAIVYLDDEWGRGFSQNFGSAATEEGMEILISADFALGSAADTEVAVSRVGSTGARVILLVAYGNEVLNVYAAAKKLDLLADYLWVIPFDIDLQAVASGSADQEATRAGMVGWISCFPDPMYLSSLLLYLAFCSCPSFLPSSRLVPASGSRVDLSRPTSLKPLFPVSWADVGGVVQVRQPDGVVPGAARLRPAAPPQPQRAGRAARRRARRV